MKFAKKFDIVVIIVTIVTAILAFLLYNVFNSSKNEGKIAEIYYKNELIKQVELNDTEEYEFSVENHPNVIFKVYTNGSIEFHQSDCPDKVCINSGRLSVVGQNAACLPNLMFLKIVSANEKNDNAPDIVV